MVLCKKCNQYGSISDNKCTVCIDGYSLVTNNHNIENCYPNCSHYIYFDNDVFHCTDDDNCPAGYKLINTKKRCVRDCQSSDNIYNYEYEYNNGCYEEGCPGISHPISEGSKICVDDLNCPIYYNYYHNECISTIPEGYYPNDTRTIDKCYDRCKTCNEGGTETQNNCQTCKDEYPYFYYNGNCYTQTECINGVIETPTSFLIIIK